MKATYFGKLTEIDTSNFEYSDDIYQKAYNLTRQYFYDIFQCFMGVKVDENYMYVKGGDNGFPHTRSHVKIDLSNDTIVETYGAHDCPIEVGEEFGNLNID